MEARAQRRIKDGREYDSFFPAATVEDHRKKKDAGVEDTLLLIRSTIPQTLWHTEKIAKVLKGRDLYETCSNIWHFVYAHIRYKRDEEGVEQVRSPRRSWHDRFTGVDCDCYTEFISSILTNLGIPHKGRIAMYSLENGWQHIYPVVPIDGKLNHTLRDRSRYIVIDCVKDAFDDEQPYLEIKDYNMRLDYLDGIPEQPTQYANVDAQDLDVHDLGSLKSLVNKAKKNLSTVAKAAGKVVQTVAKDTGKAIRFVNRYANPATILLRNGFLESMKLNLMNVPGKLRYAYLTDAQAQSMGVDMNELKKLRSIKDKAESVYYAAGGEKANLKKAILNGKGNKDKKVPLNGLYGFGSIEEVYADPEEYRILHADLNGTNGLGEPITAAAITAAAGAVAALGVALKSIKNIFKPESKEAKDFNAENPDGGDAGALTMPNGLTFNTSNGSPMALPSAGNIPLNIQNLIPGSIQTFSTNTPSAGSQGGRQPYPMVYNPNPSQGGGSPSGSRSGDDPDSNSGNDPSGSSSGSDDDSDSSQGGKNLPAKTAGNNLPVVSGGTAQPAPPADSKGFIDKTTDWVKANPLPTVLIAGAAIGSGYMLYQHNHHSKRRSSGLSGIPRKRKGKHKQTRKHKKSSGHRRRHEVYALKLS